MIHVLITGGAGFIGSSLAQRLLQNERYNLILVDNLLTGDERKVPGHPRCRFIRCDVNHYESIAAIMSDVQFDYVFHFAAVVGVQRTLDNPLMVLNDLEGIKNILTLCKNTKVKRVFFSSSSEVYGEPVELPQNEETTPLNSRLPYAIVKNAGESFCRSFYQEFGLEYTVFRFFNTYGPRQSTDFVISRFIRAALKNQPINIFGNGSQTRTFCFIDDNTDCIVRILEQGVMLNDVINIGSKDDINILELARLIIRLTNSKSEITFLPALKEGDMTRRQPDNHKMVNILKRDLISLETGLKNILSSDMIFIR